MFAPCPADLWLSQPHAKRSVPQERLHEGTGLSGQPGICSRRIRFLVNKYAHCGETATELDCDAWLIREAPSNKSWYNAHLYLQASRKSLERAASMRTLMFFDHLMPHLSLIATLAVAAYSILMKNWILTGCAGFSFLLLFIVRMLIANKAIKHFDDGIAMFKLPFFEYGIIWRNLATKLRYWRADKTISLLINSKQGKRK